MKTTLALSLGLILFASGCTSDKQNRSTQSVDDNIITANAFLDAFYSFDKDSLNRVIDKADETAASILFYQGWAQGGNYAVLERHPCFYTADSIVTCPVTVKDDLIQALELDMNVTDTFHITLMNGIILSIATSSNDPPLFYEARQWVRDNRQHLTDGPCNGEDANPAECARSVVRGFKEFVATLD